MPFTVRAGTLIDGTGSEPQENATITVDGDRIVAVEAGAQSTGPASDNGDVIDATDYFVLPGLIDCHLHLTGSGDPNDSSFGPGGLARSIPDVTLTSYRSALKNLSAGYTTVRDAGSQHMADIGVRSAINRGDLPGPRIWASGMGITSTAGHMDRNKYLAPHVNLPPGPTVADGPVEARRAVRYLLRFDVDIIKFNATLTEHVRRYFGYCGPEMTADTMKALVSEAHSHGRKVTAHCYGFEGADWALEAGLDGIDHGFYLSDEQLDRMVEQGTFLCPTLSVVGKFRDLGRKALGHNDSELLDAWRKKAIDAAWETVGRAHSRGVTIVSGSDAAMPYIFHGTNAYELEMLVQAGLNPMEAIQAATGRAARAIGFDDVGTVEKGKYADFILVKKNPLDDVRVLQDLDNISMVVKGGEVVVDRRGGSNTHSADDAADIILRSQEGGVGR